MISILKSADFDAWLRKLKDPEVRGRILVRISRLSFGNTGDVKPVGGGISEIRIDYGPGYRVYFKKRGDRIAVLLCGGDKSTQHADIARAKKIAAEWRDE